MISEFMVEKEHMIENNSKLDDHVLLKAYYEKTTDYTNNIDFDIICLILKKSFRVYNEGNLRKLYIKAYLSFNMFRFDLKGQF